MREPTRRGRPRRGVMARRAAECHGDARDDHRDRGERGQARTETATPTRRPVAGHRGVPRVGSGSGAESGCGAGSGPGAGSGSWAWSGSVGDGARAPRSPAASAPPRAASRRPAGSLRSRPSITGPSGQAWGDGSSSSATTAVRLASTPSRSNGGWPSTAAKRGTQRPHVRGSARASAAGPFGRKVGRRPEQHARYGQGRAVGGLGDPEIGQHHPAVRAEQDVSRFHVTVHHAASCTARRAAGRSGRPGPPRRESWARLRPRHRAASGTASPMTMDGRSPSSMMSYTPTTFGWRTRAASCASRTARQARHLPAPPRRAARPDDFLDRHVAVEQFVARPPDSAHPRGQ